MTWEWWVEVERAAREVEWAAMDRLSMPSGATNEEASAIVFDRVGRLVDLIAKYEEDE